VKFVVAEDSSLLAWCHPPKLRRQWFQNGRSWWKRSKSRQIFPIKAMARMIPDNLFSRKKIFMITKNLKNTKFTKFQTFIKIQKLKKYTKTYKNVQKQLTIQVEGTSL